MLCLFTAFLGGTLYAYSIIGYELLRLWNLTAMEVGIPHSSSLAAYGYPTFLGEVLETAPAWINILIAVDLGFLVPCYFV